MSDTTEKVIDTAADAVEEVAENAEEFERLIRSMNKTKVKFYFLGMAIGAATGAVIAYKVAYKRAETKFSQIADDEIADMRRNYQEKKVALEAEVAKRPLTDIVKERGYSSPDSGISSPPMAVQPPNSVVEDAEDNEERSTDPRPPVPVIPRTSNIFTDEDRAEVDHALRDTSRDPDAEWDWHEERKRRSPNTPYVIHYDERHDTPDYQDVALTYYVKDDVVANERDEPMDPEDRDKTIGEANLERFGHGSGDEDIVFVRNDDLELIFEIDRADKSFAEVVHGFHHEDLSYGNLESMHRRERDDPED